MNTDQLRFRILADCFTYTAGKILKCAITTDQLASYGRFIVPFLNFSFEVDLADSDIYGVWIVFGIRTESYPAQQAIE